MASSIWQDRRLITKHLVRFLSPCEWPSCPWKPQAPTPFLSSEWCVYLILAFCLWASVYVEFPYCEIKFDFLLWLVVMSTWFLDQPEEHRRGEESFFLPDTHSILAPVGIQWRARKKGWKIKPTMVKLLKALLAGQYNSLVKVWMKYIRPLLR